MALERDEQKSRIEKGYDQGLGAYSSANISELENTMDTPSDTDLRSAEANPDNPMNFTGNNRSVTESKGKKVIAFAKKRGGIIGVVSLLGIGGSILAGFFGPASMLINMMENFTLANDTSSVAMERRFVKVFGNLTNTDKDPICKNSTKSMPCHLGRISNKALYNLQKKGVTAVFSDGQSYDNSNKKGYPSGNPTKYEVDTGNGRVVSVNAKDMPGFLLQQENRSVASKILGTRGAFNLRVKAWTGKHISKKVYDRFKLSRNGGLAEGLSEKLETPSEKLQEIANRIEKKIPGMGDSSEILEKVRGKVEGHVGKAKKGGLAYVASTAACVGVQIPKFVAAGVAATQLAQIMPFAMEFVLSPGSKAKASGVDTANSITSQDMDSIGSALTNKTKNADGKMTSALDSKYLLAAMGVNKGKPAVSEKFTPGYSALKSEGVIIDAAKKADDATKDACNVITSPAAMYTSMAADAAITIVASATIIGGVVKAIGTWAVGELAAKAAGNLVGGAVENAIKDIAKNDDIPKAKGEELGDVIGLSAMSFFSSGGMARNLPTMSESQVVAYSDIQKENESFNREMEIASLSPLDISSRYTFLGSIAYSMQMAYLQNSHNPIGTLSSIFQIPDMMSSDTYAATNQTVTSCNYADDFGISTGNPQTTPAINAVGMPCTGITEGQVSMSTDEALQLLTDEGWLDTSIEIKDTDTIDSLMPNVEEDGYSGSGYIKKDTPLYEFINSCSDASRGDYLFNLSGCIITPRTGGITANISKNDLCNTDKKDSDGNYSECLSGDDTEDADIDVKNPKSLEAMSVFLLDFQIMQSINGEDDEGMYAAYNESDSIGDSLDESLSIASNTTNIDQFQSCLNKSDGPLDREALLWYA